MSGEYPSAWSALKYPNIRAELMAWLEDACRAESYLDYDEIHFMIHFFFDDHDFTMDGQGEPGLVLFDLAELDAMAKFLHAFAHALGPGKRLPELDKVDWQPACLAAANLQAVLLSPRPTA